MTMLPEIGFVGVGRMGSNMARRLKDCEYPVVSVYDAIPAIAEALAAELGCQPSFRLAEVTRQADIIITVVSDDTAMSAIYENPVDNLLIQAEGKLFINCATVSPAIHTRLKETADKLGAKMLETPMASSIDQARQGTLFLMCAGDPNTFEEAKPILQALSAKLIYTGAPGTAASLKTLVNMVMNINTAGLAEGLGLADALGLDLSLVRQVFSLTGAASRVLETDGEDMQNHSHDTYFSAAHAAKDSHIAVVLGEAQGLSLPLARATLQQYDQMIQFGLGELDKSGISELTFKHRLSHH